MTPRRTPSAAVRAEPAAARGRTPSQDVEAALVNAAERVLVREGLSGVTVRAVAAEADVAPMGVYNRFGSKDGLIQALVIRAFDLLRDAVSDRGEPEPLERLKASGRRYREFALSHPAHYDVIFVLTPGRENGHAAEAVQPHAAAAFGALVDHVAYGQQQGAIRAGDPVELAQQIWSAVHGAVTLELSRLILTPDPAATYEHLLELLVAGVRA